MSSRALRKLQRQQEEKRRLEQESAAPPGDESDESEEEIVRPNARQKSAFELLSESLPAEDDHRVTGDTSEDEDERDNEDGPGTGETKPTPAPGSNTKKRKKSKKKKKKSKEQATTDVMTAPQQQPDAELDEIDLALRDLKVKNEAKPTTSEPPSGPSTELRGFYQLLAVDSKNLKVLNEMKRLFGSSVLEGENESGAGGRQRGHGPRALDLGAALDRRNSPNFRGGPGLSERVLRKNIFVQGKEGWVREAGGGLGMELVEQAEDFTAEYCYVHSSAYQRSQGDFDAAVETMDPQQVISFLQFHPYHISGLLQVSEIARQHQEPAVAVDLIERALFSFGRAAHSTFGKALAEGTARLDFRRPENRELWLAAWRYVRSLGQRGTWRTAYEWAKLIFSLDPEGDPYQVRLVVDQLALRAGQPQQLLDLVAVSPATLDWGQKLANVQISLALAHMRLKHPRESRAALAHAVQYYPWIIARLLRELEIDRVPKSVWGKQARTPREELHAEAYVLRAKDLWNTPEAVSLLVEVAETTDALPSPPPVDETPIDLNEARHMLLDETPALLGLLPRQFTTMHTSAADPMPPDDTLASYNPRDPGAALPHTDSDVSDSDSDRAPPPAAPATLGTFRNWARRFWGASDQPDEPEAAAAAAAVAAAGGASGSDAPAAAARHAAARHAAEEQLLAEQEDAMLAAALRQSQEEWTAAQPSEPASQPADQPPPLQPDGQALPPPPPSPPPAADPPRDDPQREQRWLAGRGLAALQAFCTEHGTAPATWGFPLADERAAPVREFVARARALPAAQRRFIVEFAVPQGAGREVGDLVRGLL